MIDFEMVFDPIVNARARARSTAPFSRILIPSDFQNPISRPRGVRGYPRGVRGVSEPKNEGIRASFRGGIREQIREALGLTIYERRWDLENPRRARIG